MSPIPGTRCLNLDSEPTADKSQLHILEPKGKLQRRIFPKNKKE